ncbi:OmpA family protein [Aliiruegeria lutimaris]|uniref:OmpA-OmpF porin, OOP family n=1 Tax=Aliiruegeria lutimaris TaxID=571298 RepID=A0A1G8VVL7_9RHOB|nr:OmpA family protein [Aliiruegeria lutimaris]SDJ70144.1 OmpA-OmpF porin, OOP family [Aliiruegeria lutimaris]
MKPRALAPCLLLCLACSAASAQLSGLPAGARLEEEQSAALEDLRLPVAPLAGNALETKSVQGAVTRQAWQVPGTDLSTFQILSPLKEGLAEGGFEPLLECKDRDCGGFGFRYAMDLLPEPAMHVDLGDFRYFLAKRETEQGLEYVALVVSRSSDRGFIHFTGVGQAEPRLATRSRDIDGSSEDSLRPMPRADTYSDTPALPLPSGNGSTLVGTLVQTGRAVLEGLNFETGSSRLTEDDFESLQQLADWMNQNPEIRIVLVGHTDTEGALASNIELSRARAKAVRDRLAQQYGISGTRMVAEGVGYLSPISSNAGESGRTQNRRVEVVLSGPQ